jgi:hypothetical protein
MVAHVLDGDDGLVVLIDRQRALSFAGGFSLSPCQLELLVHQIERAFRAVAGMPTTSSGWRPAESLRMAAGDDDRSAFRAVDARHRGRVAAVDAGGHAAAPQGALNPFSGVSAGSRRRSTTSRGATP